MDLNYHLAIAHQRGLLSLAENLRPAARRPGLRTVAAAVRARLASRPTAAQPAPCPTC